MKKAYFFVLTVLTTIFVIGLAVLKVNEVCGNALFAFSESAQYWVNLIADYGALILLCMFAFGGLAGKVIKFILIAVIILALLIFILTLVAPGLFQGIFGNGQAFANVLTKF